MQERAIGKPKADENGFLGQVLAERLDNDGRVKPILWAIVDPIFRSAVDSGQIKPSPGDTVTNFLAGASVLRCQYTMVIKAWRDEQYLHGTAKLYDGAKMVWQDPVPVANPKESADQDSRIIQIQGSGDNAFMDTIRSMADTWVDALNEGPLRTQAPNPRIPDPGASQGSLPNAQAPTTIPKVSNEELLANAMKLLASGKGHLALAILLDAVDAQPLDGERRVALIQALLTLGRPAEAAEQARLAAALLPERNELWTLAARAWVQAGKPDEAQKDLNEAVARDPNNPEIRLLLAEMAALNRSYDAALSHAQAACQGEPTARAHFVRGVLLAVTKGDSTLDFEAAQKKGLWQDDSQVRSLCEWVIGLIRGATDEQGTILRTLYQEAKRNPADATIADRIKEAEQLFGALGVIADHTTAPQLHQPSWADLRLALKLLSQSLSELEGFLSQKDEDSYADAMIDLGEGLKLLQAALDKYRTETSDGEQPELCTSVS